MNRSFLARRFWDRSSFLSTKNQFYKEHLISFLDSKIREDAKADITTQALIDKKRKAVAILKAKEKCILAGLEETVFYLKSKKIAVTKFRSDGDLISNGSKVMEIRGNAHAILTMERTLLNLIQRMSGIATATSQLNKKIHNRCFILGTRKTVLDYFDKKAIAVGGGLTHRLSLNDSILIKDNHLKLLNNDIKMTVRKAARAKNPIEIEIKNEKEALVAAKELSTIKNDAAIMFDNMAPKKIRAIIKKIKDQTKNPILFEASGGITEKNIEEYANTGVDALSLGSLTHSVKACDFSLKII